MNLSDLVLRLDLTDIQEHFFSNEFIQVLQMIRPEKLKAPNDLHDHILKNFSNVEILRSNKLHVLLDRMLENEGKELLERLNVKINDNNQIHKKLSEIKLRKGSKSEKILFEYFNQNIPEDNIRDEETLMKAVENISPERKLFDHQRSALEEIYSYLNNGRRRCLLHMPTGSGKTTTAMRAVARQFLEHEPSLIIWLAYSEDLCEQAIDEFKKTWKNVGNRDITLYRFFGGYTPDILESTRDNRNGLIVASLGKMNRKFKKTDVFLSKLADRINFVIMDEAHQAVARTYSTIITALTEKRAESIRLLGLSATPGRGTTNIHEDTEQLRIFFDGKLVSLNVQNYDNPIEYLIDEDYLARPNIRTINAETEFTKKDRDDLKDDLDIPDGILEKLTKDTIRTYSIINQIKRLVEDGHKRIMVFGATVRNSKEISMLLSLDGYVSFHVDGSTPSINRRENIARYKSDDESSIIMCNFGVFTTGFDAPSTSAALIARPTKSAVLYSQMVGRAMRGVKVGGNRECEIVTVTDINLGLSTSVIDSFGVWRDMWE